MRISDWSSDVALPILSVATMIARALAAVHGMGILHTDLQPANILIDRVEDEPVVRLVDFGSGRLLDDAVLANYRITAPGSLDADLGRDDPRSGTLAQHAPDPKREPVPTANRQS